MSKKRNQDIKEIRHTMNFWNMTNNILLASLNRGQFIPASVFIIVLVGIMRMPEGDVTRFLYEVLADLKNGALLGYIWGGLVTYLWFKGTKALRKQNVTEMKRIVEERNHYQAKQIGEHNVKSSEVV